jgi:hypothetical protein
MRVLVGLVAVVGLSTGTGQTLRATVHASASWAGRRRGPPHGDGLDPTRTCESQSWASARLWARAHLRTCSHALGQLEWLTGSAWWDHALVGPTLGEGHVVGLRVPHDGRPSMMFCDDYRFGQYVVRLTPHSSTVTKFNNSSLLN